MRVHERQCRMPRIAAKPGLAHDPYPIKSRISTSIDFDERGKMIIGSAIRAQALRGSFRSCCRVTGRSSRSTRRYASTSAPSMNPSAPQSQASMLATITTDLDNIAPRFEIAPEKIRIIKTPTEFYETLKVSTSLPLYTTPVHLALQLPRSALIFNPSRERVVNTLKSLY